MHETDSTRSRTAGTKPSHMEADAAPSAEEVTSQADAASVQRVVWVVRVNIMLYAACFWIQQAFLPYLAERLEVNQAWYGYSQTLFAVVQLAGGPLYGRLGDLRGARAALTLAFVACAVQYAMLAATNSVPMLFLSRVPALFIHAMTGSQMVITDLSLSADRADALAKLGVAYGVGMVVGPLVGGFITKQAGFYAAALVAAAGSLVSVVWVLRSIPQHTKRHVSSESLEDGSVFDVKKLLSLLSNRQAAVILAIKLFAGLPLGIFQSMFTMLALKHFGLEADKNGMLMAYIGVLSMATQAFAIGFLTKRFSETKLLLVSNVWLTGAYFLLSLVVSVFQLCLVLLPLCTGLSVMNAVVSSLLTKTVSEEDTGAMIGVSMATHSVIRTVAPSVGGLLVQWLGFPVFGLFGCLVSSVIALFLITCKPALPGS